MSEKPIVDFEIEGDLAAQEALKNASHAITGRMVVHVIAQSHLDLMWKWDRKDIHEMIRATFEGHAALLEANPSYTYAQGQIFLYDYVRLHFPELFERIRALVAEGRWEIVGGQWVEPDSNLPDDESAVRQFLVGQAFAKQYFGKTATVGWYQDAFGMNPNMPQLMAQAGLSLSVHKRPRHRFQALPATPYWLQGADGTRIVALRANNKGIGLPRVSEGEPHEGTEIEYLHRKNAELGISDLWGPLGCGDTGGVNDYGDVPSGKHPGLDFRLSTPSAFRDAISGRLDTLPVVRDEINFEFPACYTTHADIKQANRRCELALNRAEFVASLRWLQDGTYPTETLDELWKLLLYNQFHDGVTGTGLDRVHEDSLRDYAHIEYEAARLIDEAAEGFSRFVDTSRHERPILVFNPNAFALDTVVRVDATISRPAARYALVRADGTAFPGETVYDELLDGNGNYHRRTMLFQVKGIPSCGWQLLGLEPLLDMPAAAVTATASETLLENGHYRVKFDAQGNISLLLDKALNRPVNRPGEAFAALTLLGEGNYVSDYGRPHKAWNFGFDGTSCEPRFDGAEVIESSSVRTVLRQRFSFGQSSLVRDVALYHGVRKLEFNLRLDWQEVETYAGVLFPLNLTEGAKTFHRVPFALVSRERKEECPSQNYVLTQDEDNAIALITVDRYGFSEPSANTLRMSLIRCSTDYDNRSDHGQYEFTFAVSSGTSEELDNLVQACEEYRKPPFVFRAEPHKGQLPGSFSLVDTGDSGMLVSAVKRAEDGEGLAIRLSNLHGSLRDTEVTLGVKFREAFAADILERETGRLVPVDGNLRLAFRGHEVKTILLKGPEA